MDIGSNNSTISSSLAEQVLEILPANVEWKVGHIDLTAATTSTTAGGATAISRVKMARHTACAACKATAVSTSSSDEPRLSFTVLDSVNLVPSMGLHELLLTSRT
jgi:Holliday junction resolvase-like predicted endonuclease